jgi:hypothetical protein
MRYVCLDCGEADMWKENEPSTSKAEYGNSETGHSDGSGETAMIPPQGSRPRSESTSTHTSREPLRGVNGKGRQIQPVGYELCPGCIEVHGLEHARLSSIPAGSSRRISESRHTFREKIWGPQGWQDVGKYCPPLNRNMLRLQNTTKTLSVRYVMPQSWMIDTNAFLALNSISANHVRLSRYVEQC